MFATLRPNIIAGFGVFLIALPLCLGVAVASQFPPAAGILTAIIGGMLGGLLGGARLSIKGPAAGLIVVVAGAVQTLGYEGTLAVGVIAALLQIVIALMRKATLAMLIPSTVVHGMLMAIGIIVISKQLYVFLGLTPLSTKPLALLWQLPGLLPNAHFYPLAPEAFIALPNTLKDAFHMPDFSHILTPQGMQYIIVFTLIGAIESLLTVRAIDSLAPQYAPTDLNRDLKNIGICNLVSASLGGLPMISEIVRSKANIEYGATNASANFFHGFFMLMAIVCGSTLLSFVPLSVLAALLIFVGCKLASPKALLKAYHSGKDHALIFLITVLGTLCIDLLIGVTLGMISELIRRTLMLKTASE